MKIRGYLSLALVAGALGAVAGYLAAPDVRDLNARLDVRLDRLEARVDQTRRAADISDDLTKVTAAVAELGDRLNDRAAEADRLAARQEEEREAEASMRELVAAMQRSDQLMNARLDQITRRLSRISQQMAEAGSPGRLQVATSPELPAGAALVKPVLPQDEPTDR
ncbi:MAG: hypothetical protein AAF439_11645 [Pseudomonadota bacterium]